ncbi:hypothetical protein Tco_1367533 [Tanacetum coccineum]
MGLNDLHNWYQSMVALDLGSTRKAAGIVVIWLGKNPNSSRVWPFLGVVYNSSKDARLLEAAATIIGSNRGLYYSLKLSTVGVYITTAIGKHTASYVLVLLVFTLYCQRKLALFEFKDEFLCYWFSAIKEERKQMYMLRSWKPNYWLTYPIGLKRLNAAQIHGLCCLLLGLRGRFNTAGLFVYNSKLKWSFTDLSNLAIGLCYHYKELRCCAQCLIEDEDFDKEWSRSKLLIFIWPLLDYDKKGKKALTGKMLDISVALVDSTEPVCDKAITSIPLKPKTIRFPKPTSSLFGRLSKFVYGA